MIDEVKDINKMREKGWNSLKAEIDGRRRKEEEGGEEGNKVRAPVQATSDGARQ